MPPSTHEDDHVAGLDEATSLAACPEVEPKPWGREVTWAKTPVYAAKILEIRAGQRLSLQHHAVKEETIRVLSGRLLLQLDDDEGVLRTRTLLPGDSAHIRPGRRHRFQALDFVRLVEVSTPELDDVIRHEDDYGRAG